MKHPFKALVVLSFGLRISAADDLTVLSDEFRSPETTAQWKRIFQTEGWGNDALQTFELGGGGSGKLRLIPHSSTWYQEWRGELTYKEITGDFVMTTDVEVSRRGGGGPPNSLFSLAGIMIRTPRSMTSPDQWTPGGQNYVFLSLGSANTPGTYQFEVKTTVNSDSILEISPGAARATIQVARIGPHLLLLRKTPGTAWQVHRRYHRPDFPELLQAGLTVYSDWNVCDRVGYAVQNTTVLTNGARLPNGAVLSGATPDLEARFEFARFARPQVPESLLSANLSNPGAVGDAALLSFLGDKASPPPESLQLAATPRNEGVEILIRYPSGAAPESARSERILVYGTTDPSQPLDQWQPTPLEWQQQAAGWKALIPASDTAQRFFRVAELP